MMKDPAPAALCECSRGYHTLWSASSSFESVLLPSNFAMPENGNPPDAGWTVALVLLSRHDVIVGLISTAVNAAIT